MPKIIEGYEFPDDATAEEISSFLRLRKRAGTERVDELPPEGKAPAKKEMPLGEYLKGLGRSTAAGATFNFADEGIAGIRSLIEGTSYADALADERKKLKDFQSQYPVAGTAAEVVGAVPSMFIPGLGGVRAAQIGARAPTALGRAAQSGVGQGAVMGAKQGALSGAGAAEGGLDIEGLASRAMGAGTGAATGAAVGAGVTAGINALRPTGRAIAERFNPKISEDVAMRKVLDDLDRAKLTPQTARDEVERMRKAGAPAQLFDVARPLTTRADALVQRPGGAGERIVEDVVDRNAGQRGRVMSAIQSATGTRGPINYYESFDAANAALRVNAKPLYDAAYQAKIPFEAQAQLQEIADRVKRSFPSAESYARRLYAAEKDNFGNLGTRDVDLGTGVSMKAFDTLPQVQQYDLLMRGLNQASRAQPPGSELGRSAGNLRREIAEVLDSSVPDFAKARSVYKGDIEVRDALEAGKAQFLSADPELLAREFKNFSVAEKQAYRIGAMKAVRDKLYGAADNADATKKAGQNVADRRAALRVIIPNRVHARLLEETLAAEARMIQNSQRITGGSPTAQRTAALKDLDPDDMNIFGIAAEAAQGRVTPLFNRMIGALSKNMTIPEQRADAISKLLRSGSTAELNRAVKALEGFVERSERQQVQNLLGTKRAAAVAARPAGAMAAEEDKSKNRSPPPLTIYGPGGR